MYVSARMKELLVLFLLVSEHRLNPVCSGQMIARDTLQNTARPMLSVISGTLSSTEPWHEKRGAVSVAVTRDQSSIIDSHYDEYDGRITKASISDDRYSEEIMLIRQTRQPSSGIGEDMVDFISELNDRETFTVAVTEVNITMLSMNDTKIFNDNDDDNITSVTTPRWSIVFDRAQLGLTTVGLIANVMTFAILICSSIRYELNSVTLFLLRHQSIIDALVCLAGALLMILPEMWSTGIHLLDEIICHVWHSQAFYWLLVILSTYSLILIAVERFFAVCRPFRHQDITVHSAYRWVLVTYIWGVICTSGASLQSKMSGDRCVAEYVISGQAGEIFMAAFAISTWFTFFAIPAALFVFLYGRVIYTFRQRKAAKSESHIIDKATKELTKTAIVVTVIFIISLGFDLNYYVLGYTGVTEYKVGSPLQKVGVLFAMLNSCVNPFVYTLILPVYRKHMIQTFFRCCPKHTTLSGNKTFEAREVSSNTRNSMIELT